MGGVEGSVLDTAEVRVILVSVFVSSNQALFDQLEIFRSAFDILAVAKLSY